ncbi:hypothetical protein AcdelDRAFT_1888 [Acidovorax delafieldii 2AN]|uniref:Uncharacterized protein n=2 Tax=Acidovorax delafieldii TaxID=47920 RepID=C5T4Q8_ACIDE|nr:hypothetical protein AcdelDRAFT_1888 [Acidovorax delafieldii 2AN]
MTVLAGFAAATASGFLIPFALIAVWQRSALKEAGAILIALALIGASAGTAGGMSRVGAIGSIVPAFLGLLGGLSLYLFGLDRSKGLIASFGAAAVSLALIVSYSLGAKQRNVAEDHRDIRSICAQAYTNQKLLSDPIAYAEFRRRLGEPFCNDAMNWWITP